MILRKPFSRRTRTRLESQARLTTKSSAHRQQPVDGDVQGTCKDNQFKINHATKANFNLADAGPVDFDSHARDTLRQLLLREPRSRPQSRLADTRSNDVLSFFPN